MSQINTELGRSSTATISLDTAENGGYGAINTCSPAYPNSGNPARISEWYSYNRTAPCLSALLVYLNTSLESTCYGSSATVYTSGNTITTGAVLYYNSNLTGLVTGYTYVKSQDFGSLIYVLNSSNGTVGISTGQSC